MSRPYGSITLKGDTWRVEAEPHVMMRLRRVFGKVAKKQHGTLTFPNTYEACRELAWFADRYPMEIDPADVLESGARRHRESIQRLEDLIGGTYEPTEFKLAVPARQYQMQAAAVYLEQGHLLLADDVGLGKTAGAICSFTDKRTLPAAVVCLAHLPGQWFAEIKKFAPDLLVHIIKKGTPYQLPTLLGRGPDVLILSYHKLAGWSEVLAKHVKSVVFDECQELRRGESAKYEAAVHLAAHVPFRMGLSATPVYNYGSEIYNVLNVLKPEALGTRVEFENEWHVDPLGRIKDPKALGTYMRESFHMLRRTRQEVARELPPVIRIPHVIENDAKALDDVKPAARELARVLLAQTQEFRGQKMQAAEALSNALRQATGIAKCLAPGTRVLKADGSIEVVERLKEGDLLLGPDGEPRRITATVRGSGEMYEVSSTARSPLFEPYVVNGDHVLALKHSGNVRHGDRFLFGPYVQGDHVEISVSDYLGKSAHFRRLLKGYKAGVEFASRHLPIDPYFLGLWLGDGSSETSAITTADPEVVNYLNRFAAANGVRVRAKHPNRTAPTYFLCPGIRGGNMRAAAGRNRILTTLRSMGVLHNKHIPPDYLTASRTQRMSLLAGLIDSDGHLNCPGVYTIVTRWRHLAAEVCRLSWSLGLAGKTRAFTAKDQHGNRFPAYRVTVYGNGLEALPVLVPRKKSPRRRQIKDPLRSGIAVKPVGLGPYYGFALDGDGLFLLHDYTVTHNSPYVADFVRLLIEAGERVVVCAWHRAVYEILRSKLSDLKPALYTGSESAGQKAEAVARFSDDKRPDHTPALLLSLRSGAGLDGLQKVSRTIVFAELDWSPGVIDQCIGRLARDGQDSPVTAYFLLAEDGADPVMSETLGLKRQQAEGIRNPTQDIADQLDTSGNNARRLAEDYLRKHGAKEIDWSTDEPVEMERGA